MISRNTVLERVGIPENREVSTTVQSTRELVKRRKKIAFLLSAGCCGVVFGSDIGVQAIDLARRIQARQPTDSIVRQTRGRATHQSPPKRRWRRAYSSRAAQNCPLRKSGHRVGVITNSV